VGFPDEDLQKVTRSHPGNRYRSCADSIHFYFLKDGDRLNVGDYEFVCVSTPGHTKGHLCLHESKEKVLLAGDHILKDITPTIQLWNDRDNPLGEYYNSLRKVDLLDIGLVLPGHRDVFDHVTERIREIRSLHLQRSEEILMVLAKKRETAYQLASEVQWNSDGETWSSFPEFHRWLATGEVLAHLRFLEEKGRVRKIRKSRPVLFEKTLSSNF
jgi:glyoxylase-like metal-dependent hydrolase (beta-lactamase superfamily II)